MTSSQLIKIWQSDWSIAMHSLLFIDALRLSYQSFLSNSGDVTMVCRTTNKERIGQ